MSQAERQEFDQLLSFYRTYYADEIAALAQRYPSEQRSLYLDYDDLFTFDPELAERFLDRPDDMLDLAEEALRTYDLPADISLGQAHVRLRNLPADRTVEIRSIRVQDDHVGSLIAVRGIVRKATDVRPRVVEAAFECQRCGTMTYIPQSDTGFQEPHECQGCERQGPFRVNHDQSEFVDSQKLQVQESPEGLRGGETPQSIDVNLEDDICGKVTPGDHVTVVGVLHIDQVTSGNEKTPVFDLYMDGVSVTQEDEEFENMEIDEADVQEILELSADPDIYDRMVASIAPSIYGFDQEKLAMALQLFSGVTKHLPDGSRVRGDLHMLLIGDPGTGKCTTGETTVRLADGTERRIRELVESRLEDPVPVDDGVYQPVDIEVLTSRPDGTVGVGHATKVWKREAPTQMYRLRTASGRGLEATPSHPLFVQTGGRLVPRRMADLAEGEFIAIPRGAGPAGETSSDADPDRIPNLGPVLRQVREALGISRAAFSIPESTYRQYERGDLNPHRASLECVVQTFERRLERVRPADARSARASRARTDGGGTAASARPGDALAMAPTVDALRALVDSDLGWDRIETIEPVEPADDWVYDLEVEGTHTYLSNGILSHNSQLLSYIRNVAPRSVYTSGKGSSAAGLTAAAVRSDFGDGQQWTLEAGALVLADKGIAAIDELDKMDAGDRSAMHQGLEQQEISVSKAGINATLKARCSLLGAANPKYGRFDQYEPIGEQIDLEPALISRFDLIFTVTDQPDPEEDARLAEHILDTNYAGELRTQRDELTTAEATAAEVEAATEEVQPAIEPELFRKYIAYAKRNCFPRMTDEARATIRDFYVDMRSEGLDEDSPVPITARKIEALIRLAEASARVRLSDTVDQEDAERVIDIVQSSLETIGVDPETGQFDADVIETGTSKSQRDRIRNLKELIAEIEDEYEEGAPVEEVIERADEAGVDPGKAEDEIQNLRTRGEIYEPQTGYLRTT